MATSESPLFHLQFLISYQVIYRDARILFKAGKNRDGWFGSSQLLAQVDQAVDVFEGLTKGNAQGLFLFDNAPSHRKRAPDAISALHMPKSASSFPLPKSSSDLENPYAHRSARELDTHGRRATHARRPASHWRIPVFSLPPRPSYDAILVQGDGGHYSRTRTVAGSWSASTVSKFSMPGWKA
jgi:hypothetical protein